MKLSGFNKGITMCAGLPVILTTPAHGTAFDIAGKGAANEGATVATMQLVVRMSQRVRGRFFNSPPGSPVLHNKI